MKYRKLKAPISVQFEITEICNNNCIHCYNHWREDSNSFPKSLEKKELLFVAEKLSKNQIFSVVLTGGEPLIAWEGLLSIIKKLVLSGIKVSLNSNLILLDKEKAVVLKDSGLKNILVSVLSDKMEIHDKLSGREGAWQATIEGIKTAISQGLRVSANMVLLQQNFDRIYETASFLKQLGIRCFSATKASPALNSKNFDNSRITKEQLRESLKSLERIKKELNIQVDILECYPLCLIGDLNRFSYFARRSCTAGVTTCTIGADGKVRPCSHSDISYGNIFEEELSEIWSKMSDWRDGEYIPDGCIDCRFLRICSGGCRMEAKYSGDIKGKDPYMTVPNDVILKKNYETNLVLNIEERYALGDDLCFREEDFGAVVKTEYSGAILINKDGYEMLKTIASMENFTLTEILNKLNNEIRPDKLVEFLRLLIKKKVIQPVASKNEEVKNGAISSLYN